MPATTRTHIVLPAGLLAEIDALVGTRKRSEFVVAVLQERLKRERLLRAIHRLEESPPTGGPPEWNTDEGIANWVHDQRAEEGPTERWLRESEDKSRGSTSD